MAALCESFLGSLRNATHNSADHGFVALVCDGRTERSMVARVFEKLMSRITCIEAILLRERERELARVCFDCLGSLFCNGLCAAVWRNSTCMSIVLLF